MGMSIDIDGSIKELSKWRKNLNYDNGDYCYGDDTTKHSLDVTISTMRKYQKIEEIIKSWKDGTLEENDSVYAFHEIMGVVEDGNVD